MLAWWELHGRRDPVQKPWMFKADGQWPGPEEGLNPYPIHVAEVMLQQTQLQVVLQHHLGHMNRIGIETLIRPRPLTIRLEHPGLLNGIPPTVQLPPSQQSVSQRKGRSRVQWGTEDLLLYHDFNNAVLFVKPSDLRSIKNLSQGCTAVLAWFRREECDFQLGLPAVITRLRPLRLA